MSHLLLSGWDDVFWGWLSWKENSPSKHFSFLLKKKTKLKTFALSGTILLFWLFIFVSFMDYKPQTNRHVNHKQFWQLFAFERQHQTSSSGFTPTGEESTWFCINVIVLLQCSWRQEEIQLAKAKEKSGFPTAAAAFTGYNLYFLLPNISCCLAFTMQSITALYTYTNNLQLKATSSCLFSRMEKSSSGKMYVRANYKLHFTWWK